MPLSTGVVLLLSLIPPSSSRARAHGGAVRLCEQAGAYHLAVFTILTPFRAGPVDVSVLVQDAATGECMTPARVTLQLTARGSGQVLEYQATSGAATDKLFHEAVFELPEAGWWNVEVSVDGPQGPAGILARPTGEEQPKGGSAETVEPPPVLREAVEPLPVSCPACGAAIRPEQTRCPDCGIALR
jgi:hypothetical protein